ncbi:MAG: branched-chain amino acid transport system substrate-binding protein, partial [Acidimicrobiaceae bacterium]|nr:branched-chain amino acid transport system substrate-binding protein [Acidimicrobiaceae bacterium]
MIDAIQSFTDYVNNVEGGINGRPLQLSVKDDGGDPARTVAAYRAASDEGVAGILGVPIASQVAAAGDVAKELKLSLITVGAIPSVLRTNPQYLFQVDATTGSDAQPTATFAADLMKGKTSGPIKIALAPHNSPSADEWAKAIKDIWAPKLGETVTTTVTVPLAAPDVTSQAQQLVSSKPDVIMFTGIDAGLPALVQRVRVLGFTGPMIAYHGAGSDKNLSTLNDANVFSERELRSLDEDPAKYPGLARFKAAMERGGKLDTIKSNLISHLGSMGFLVAEGAFKKCANPCDRAAFNTALNDLSVDTKGLTGANIQYSSTNRQGVTSSTFYHFVSGKLVAANDSKVYHGDVYTMIAP